MIDYMLNIIAIFVLILFVFSIFCVPFLIMLTIVNCINYSCNKINYVDSDEDDDIVNNKVSDDSDEDDDNVNDESDDNEVNDNEDGVNNESNDNEDSVNKGNTNEYLRYIDRAGKYSISD